MKNVLMNGHNLAAKLFSVIAMLLVSTFAVAQDKGIDIDVDLDKGNNWYANPIVWIIAAAVFILLLVALLRGNSNKV